MKQKDLIMLIVVVFISVIVSIFVSKLLFGSAKYKDQSVDVVPTISAGFEAPNPQYFNNQAIDPTQLIKIGNTNNPAPFNSPTN